MGVGAPPEYVNGDLNSQFGMKANIHTLSEVRAPPTSISYVGCCIYVSIKDIRDAHDIYANKRNGLQLHCVAFP